VKLPVSDHFPRTPYGLQPLLTIQGGSQDLRAWQAFLDGEGQLYMLSPIDQLAALAVVGRSLVPTVMRPTALLVTNLGTQDGRRSPNCVAEVGFFPPVPVPNCKPLPLSLEGSGPPAMFAGRGHHLSHPLFGLLAVRVGDNRYRIFHRKPGEPWLTLSMAGEHVTTEMTLPDDLTPVGVTVENDASEPVMVAIEDRCRIVLVQRRTQRALHTRLPATDSPIVRAATTPLAPFVAWFTEAGEITVWSLEHKAAVLRVLPNETAAVSAKQAAGK
jgi:hypothetical protein